MEGRYPKDFKFIGWHPNCKERSGGYYVVHKNHKLQTKGGGGDAELDVSMMLAKYNGKQVELVDEQPRFSGDKIPDLRFDGQTWDVKAINNANVETIRKYIKNARKADCAIFYWDKESAKLEDLHSAVNKEMSRLSKENRVNEIPDIYYMQNGLLRLLWKK